VPSRGWRQTARPRALHFVARFFAAFFTGVFFFAAVFAFAAALAMSFPLSLFRPNQFRTPA
jgi:hypothetical protein